MVTVNDYLKSKYGCKVYKLALSAKVTCPNRDGTLGTRGCIFCSEGGSGEFAAGAEKSVNDQILEAKARVAAKAGPGAGYIAYFQSFTNTYGDFDYLSRMFREAIGVSDVVILSIATRPDCISDEMYGLLEELNKIKPVWVELGLQTANEQTARYIRRCYELPVYDECVARLRSIGIEVITHVILGLPGETREDMAATVRHVVEVGSNGIKLQLLHVLRGTDLEREYRLGKVPVMELDEYVDLLMYLLTLIPDNVVVHRLTGDGPKKGLLAPLWTGDKKKVLNTINAALKERKTNGHYFNDRR
ncbi:MAG: TIGR01212 family radical SAM protein [Lachnospiraceae bacterium]|nr:TIGR01212 family radical SAM protein [Lachnospiraceae bacterium]